jgi:hypothetical protein
MPTGVATAPTPAGKADRAHPVGVMCRAGRRATLSLLDMGSEGVFPAVVLTLSIGIGLIMTFLGLGTGMLSARAEPRRCPSCGVRLSSRTCRRCRRE